MLIYTFGMLIGQDIWQRVFTARSDKVARLGGTVAGTYCLVYALAGAVIGTAAKVLYPKLRQRRTTPSRPSSRTNCPWACADWCWPPRSPR